MHRIDHATRAIDLHGTGKDGFTEGSPGVTPPTVVTADITNALQEEIANAIEARGIALSKPSNTQLKEALSDPLTAVYGLVRPDLAGVRGAFAGSQQAQAGWDVTDSRPAWHLTSSSGQAGDLMVSHTAGGLLSWTFTAGDQLPFGCIVTGIRVWFQGATFRSAGSRPSATYTTLTPIPTVSTPKEAADGTAFQSIRWSGLSIPMVATDTDFFVGGDPLALVVTLKSGTPTAGGDTAYLCEVRYTLQEL